MPEGTLSFVNPQYLKSFTHPGHKLDEIWVPEDYQKAVESKSAELAVYKVKVRAEVSHARPVRNRVPVYSVKRGDTLKSIARKRGLSVAYLKQVNGLKSSRVSAGQHLKLAASSYRQKRVHPRKHKRRRGH
jgi:LysM repeat protein